MLSTSGGCLWQRKLDLQCGAFPQPAEQTPRPIVQRDPGGYAAQPESWIQLCGIDTYAIIAHPKAHLAVNDAEVDRHV
jgi:hypothetical protein